MNKKILIVLTLICLATIGYFYFIQKNYKNYQILPTNQAEDFQPIEDPQPSYSKEENFSGIIPINFPSSCNVYLESFASSSIYDLSSVGGKRWLIDCGKSTLNNSRGFMNQILKTQGWNFCGLATAHASWWQEGVVTSVSESVNSSENSSYPFELIQYYGPDCAGL